MTDEQIVDVTFWPFVYTLHSAHVNTKPLNQPRLISSRYWLDIFRRLRTWKRGYNWPQRLRCLTSGLT